MIQPDRREQNWLLRQVHPDRWLHILSFAFIVVASITSLLAPLIMKWLIDNVLPARAWRLLPAAAACFFLAYSLQIGSYWVSSLITFRAVQRMTFRIRVNLLEHLQRLSADYHDRTSAGETLFRLEQDVEQIGDLCGDIIPNSIRALLMTLFSFGAMLFLNKILACLIFPLIPVFLCLSRHYQDTLQEHCQSVLDLSGKRSSFLHECVPAVMQIQLLGRERTQSRKFAQLAAAASRGAMQRELAAMRFGVASILIIILATVLILGYGAWQVMIGVFTVGGLVAFYGYLASLFGPLSGVVQLYPRFHRVLASINRVRLIEETVPSVRNAPGARPYPHKLNGKISFQDVWFSYFPGASVLNGINLNVEPGQRVAIVGKTGSGKSTLAKLLLRMYELERGTISVDDMNIREVDLTAVRSQIALVPQEPVLFSGSLRDNLLLGDLRATTAKLVELVETMQLATGNEAVAMLDCPCGGMSGGEKQRVALARALLQCRPILVLDEATSALDPHTEDLLLRTLRESYPSLTILAITHRQAVTMWSDQVFLMEAGRICEQGHHGQLLQNSLSYRQLWRIDDSQLFKYPSLSLENVYGPSA
jgi:ABC-type bacteriocin/lantibiotic exporter with double-glycine peptidase domain